MEQEIWSILETVADPEIPALSIVDLGMVKSVRILNSFDNANLAGEIIISLTPTYSGCPAMDMIATQVRLVLLEHGYHNILIKTVLFPAWTTDFMTEAGKQKLKEYGIAPPIGRSIDEQSLRQLKVACPQCDSTDTRLVSEFGSTACKALFICNHCSEPFDYFKCH